MHFKLIDYRGANGLLIRQARLWSPHSREWPGGPVGPLEHAKGNLLMKVRDAFYEILRTHGISTIFGNPGSNELPLLQDFPDDFRYILAPQEGAAIGMADGFAQATGRPALVNLHAAAGMGSQGRALIRPAAPDRNQRTPPR